ncbi:hypothetical protein SLA2020_516510 [Shorea laevis]
MSYAADDGVALSLQAAGAVPWRQSWRRRLDVARGPQAPRLWCLYRSRSCRRIPDSKIRFRCSRRLLVRIAFSSESNRPFFFDFSFAKFAIPLG